MLSQIVSHMVCNTVMPMIDNGTAKRIDRACFRDGNEDEYHVEFWLLWGRYIRSCYNARTTCSTYEWVDGEPAQRLAALMRLEGNLYVI